MFLEEFIKLRYNLSNLKTPIKISTIINQSKAVQMLEEINRVCEEQSGGSISARTLLAVSRKRKFADALA